MTEKPTVVILPGWGGSHETWHEFMNLAKEKYDVMCIDLPCFGGVPCPEAVWGVEEYADFVKSKIINHKSKIILLGHSFGGQIAAYLAAKHPELIEKLILSGAAALRPNRRTRRLIFGVIAKTGKLFFRLPFIERFGLWAKKVLYRASDSPDYAKTSGIQREIFKKIIRRDLSELLPSISAPTLVVWGSHDQYIPASQGKKIAFLIPGSRFVLIPRATHGLHQRHTLEFFGLVDDFISLK